MNDKRDECGCHRDCTTLPHTCDKPCRWPQCLTSEEEADLIAEVRRWDPETCMTPEEEVLLDEESLAEMRRGELHPARTFNEEPWWTRLRIRLRWAKEALFDDLG